MIVFHPKNVIQHCPQLSVQDEMLVINISANHRYVHGWRVSVQVFVVTKTLILIKPVMFSNSDQVCFCTWTRPEHRHNAQMREEEIQLEQT